MTTFDAYVKKESKKKRKLASDYRNALLRIALEKEKEKEKNSRRTTEMLLLRIALKR
jgi:HSP20 family molecular chaperone IbpA